MRGITTLLGNSSIFANPSEAPAVVSKLPAINGEAFCMKVLPSKSRPPVGSNRFQRSHGVRPDSALSIPTSCMREILPCSQAQGQARQRSGQCRLRRTGHTKPETSRNVPEMGQKRHLTGSQRGTLYTDHSDYRFPVLSVRELQAQETLVVANGPSEQLQSIAGMSSREFDSQSPTMLRNRNKSLTIRHGAEHS
jgi:hypothetical protein